MVRRVRYLTHPQVVIDPAVPVPKWPLNAVGAARVQAVVASGAWSETGLVVSSDETKALETAEPLAAAFGCPMTVHPDTHENDRSATGFLPADEFEAVANQFFTHPDQSVRGWETARAAQTRIVAAFQRIMAQSPNGDVLIVGHGGVGTLLYCALAGLPIDRAYDQGPGGGGNFFVYDPETQQVAHHWRMMEDC